MFLHEKIAVNLSRFSPVSDLKGSVSPCLIYISSEGLSGILRLFNLGLSS